MSNLAAGLGSDTIRLVDDVQLRSVSEPLDRPELMGPAISVIRRGLALGLVPVRDAQALDLALIRELAQGAASIGIGRDVALELQRPSIPPERLGVLIDRLDKALAGSPVPRRELGELWRVLGPERLAALLGVSVVSLRRYVAGERPTPDIVAARGHWLALVVSDLAGTYNEIGIRRWFERPRPQCDGRSPAQLLDQGWDPDEPAAVRVAALAAALVGPGVAT